MHPADIAKTAITCYRGLYEFVRMLFGLKNSPSSFQRLMDIVLDDVRYKYAMAYMDDVVIFSRMFEEPLVHLADVLERMSRAGFTVNPKKVQLATSNIDLLGFDVNRGELRANDEKLKAIAEYTCLRDVKSLQRFLGMFAFYMSFIPHCAELTRPLNQLLRKGVKWHWAEPEQESFAALSKAIVETAALRLPALNRPLVLQTVAGDYGLGAVLFRSSMACSAPLLSQVTHLIRQSATIQ